MTKKKTFNTISFDFEKGDYIINGKPLLEHLTVHEDVDPSMHTPSIFCEPGTTDRLINNSEPDLTGDHVAIYLCEMCGGYENPIGVKVVIEDDTVSWQEIGYYEDFEEGLNIPFKKVRGYTFAKAEYLDFLARAEVYKPGEKSKPH